MAQSPVTVTVDTQSPGYAIPADFSGLSFETMTLLPDGTGGYWFSTTNTPLITLFQNLGLKSLRIGGATVDMATVAIPTNTDIDHLFAFARAAGVKVIYSLRLLNGSTNADAALARYIWTNYQSQLDCFAIGNEPDWNSYHQSDPNITNYTSYLANWQKFATAITSAVPGATFSGPDTGGNLVTGAAGQRTGADLDDQFCAGGSGFGTHRLHYTAPLRRRKCGQLDRPARHRGDVVANLGQRFQPDALHGHGRPRVADRVALPAH